MKAPEVNDEAEKIVGQVWVKTNPAGDVISWAYTAKTYPSAFVFQNWESKCSAIHQSNVVMYRRES